MAPVRLTREALFRQLRDGCGVRRRAWLARVLKLVPGAAGVRLTYKPVWLK
jgi:hypothetical protein